MKDKVISHHSNRCQKTVKNKIHFNKVQAEYFPGSTPPIPEDPFSGTSGTKQNHLSRNRRLCHPQEHTVHLQKMVIHRN